MREFVLDASMASAWVFEDESHPLARAVLNQIQSSTAVVPALWAFEVANAVRIAVLRGRIDMERQTAFLEWLRELPVAIDKYPVAWLVQRILPIAQRYNLSAYDAAYLELALRDELPLATLDEALRSAASAAGVALVEP